MKRIAVYGKGGIGKSTISANLSAAWASTGKTVFHIGCDPKADSTRLLLGGAEARPILEFLRHDGAQTTLEDAVQVGSYNTLCVECGGPEPGRGCAGLGISTSMEFLEKQKAFERYEPDVVLYDVLGDVVCGGFAVPIRKGYAEAVYIVTSGEMMSLFAARNIATAVDSYKRRGYARLAGIILNSRSVKDEQKLVEFAAEELGTSVVAVLPRDDAVQRFEERGTTVVEGDPEADFSKRIRDLAERMLTA